MIDMRSEMCKKCIHTKLCYHTKNILGDVFVAGNPDVYDNSKLWKKYEEWKDKGFPCNDFFPEVVRCKDCKYNSKNGGTCKHICIDADDYWYCADGEKVME